MKRHGYSAERFSYIILRKGRENQKESKNEKNVFFHIALIIYPQYCYYYELFTIS